MPAKPEHNHFACFVSLLLIAALLWVGRADAQVYQCTQADGLTRYQGHPCASHTGQQPMQFAALNGMAKVQPLKTRKYQRARKAEPFVAYTDKQAKSCAAVHRSMDRVQSQLRAGYTAKKGETLKARRRKLEDKRRAACDGVPQHAWMAVR